MRHLLISVFVATLGLNSLTGRDATKRGPADTLASLVTIYRDTYGTPHVFGRTDASTVFGLAYAQAEDNFAQVEQDFALAIGRGAEIYGSDLINEDRLNRALEIEKFAKTDYYATNPRMRSLCDAFAAGINFYLEHHPNVHPQLLTRIEPWYPLAFIRYTYYQNGFARDPKLGRSPLLTSHVRDFADYHNGSNGWVIAPSRSATGHAMLFINPHLPFFGPGQVYEAHIHSDEGWEFTGYARFGFPFPYIGHNPSIGWMSTDNAADSVDGYVEHFDNPKNPLSYRYGKSHRIAEEHTEVIRVRTSSGVEPREFRMVRTLHGPILTSFEGQAVAVHLPKYESHGWLAEWYEMTHARNLVELKAALKHLDMLFGNVMSADLDGNIYYVYNAAVPRRDPQFDWTHPVDGSDPRSEWKGYYSFEELPQLTNPASGWMENCNTSPFLLTSSGNPEVKSYPKYMVREGQIAGWEADNPRGRASRLILSTTARFSFDEWKTAAFDTHVITADELLPQWLAILRQSTSESTSASSHQPIADAMHELERWDHRSTIDSVAMTVFTLWHHSLAHESTRPETLEESLREVLAQLSQRFGRWQVPFGDLNRLQRPTSYANPPFGIPAFDDDEPSLPTAAVSGEEGAPFTLGTITGKQQRRRYGVHGDTYVSAVEFGAPTHASSIMTFGESADPKSKHFFDQAPLFANGEFKPSWVTPEEVKQHSEAAYHPGKEATH